MQLESLSALVGTWEIEARHPALPDTVVAGRAVFEWFDGEKFLVQRSQNEHPDFPNSLSVIGEGEERLAMHYFDSRGVQRIYQVVMGDECGRCGATRPGSRNGSRAGSATAETRSPASGSSPRTASTGPTTSRSRSGGFSVGIACATTETVATADGRAGCLPTPPGAPGA